MLIRLFCDVSNIFNILVKKYFLCRIIRKFVLESMVVLIFSFVLGKNLGFFLTAKECGMSLPGREWDGVVSIVKLFLNSSTSVSEAEIRVFIRRKWFTQVKLNFDLILTSHDTAEIEKEMFICPFSFIFRGRSVFIFLFFFTDGESKRKSILK